MRTEKHSKEHGVQGVPSSNLGVPTNQLLRKSTRDPDVEFCQSPVIPGRSVVRVGPWLWGRLEDGLMWKRAAWYGALLAAGTFGLQWLDYQRLARSHTDDIYILLIAVAFLALGIYLGARVLSAPRPAPFAGNPKAVAALGIRPRELTVLQEMALGRSNKEIAMRLEVAPYTVKTHVAHLFEKLDARRRTEAINKARELGIVR